MEEKGEKTQETEKKEELSEEDAEILEETKIVEEGEEEISEEAEEEIFEEETEEAPPPREEEEFVEERIYTIPLGRAWIMPPKKRAPKAIRIIKAFIQKHMKVGEVAVEQEGEEKEGGKIIISNEVNEKIWSRGIEKPPRKLRIRAAKDEENNVTIFLA